MGFLHRIAEAGKRNQEEHLYEICRIRELEGNFSH